MGKHDMPSLQFTVEGGRLVPSGPYEAEVLDTYRPGSKLTVTLHQKRSLPLLKKYWAVMRDVVENCPTPWNSAEEASDAIKLATGITDIGKTVKGQWFIRPGSIAFTAMDEAAFRAFFDKAMAILAEVTGIDPEVLRGRYNHLPENDNTDTSVASSSASDDGSDGEALSPGQTVAADPSHSDEGAQAGQDGEPASSSDQTGEERAWLIKAAKMLIGAAAPGGDPDIVRRQYAALIKNETPASISQDAIAKANAIGKRLVAVCESTEELDLDLIAGLARCDVAELRT